MSLPTVKAVKDLFEGMLGRDVDTSPGDPVDTSASPGPMTGVYVDNRTTLSSLVLMDFALTAYVGAALGLVPPGGAEAAIEDGELSPALEENAAEIMNVFAALLSQSSGAHQRLYETYPADRDRPADVAGWSTALGSRRDLTVAVKGYGSGLLSIIETAPSP